MSGQEKYRLARNLKEGMEVRDTEGVWWEITDILDVEAAGLRVIRAAFVDGTFAPYGPKDQVMSR